MENLKSLRSLVATGGPPGTGRSTSSSPGTPQRDFEVDLDQARRGERRAERREESDSTAESRAEDRREARVEERRKVEQERVAEPHDGPPEPESVGPAGSDDPRAGQGQVEPQTPRDSLEARDAKPSTDASATDPDSTTRGAGAAVESRPTRAPLWMPAFPAATLVNQPTATGATSSPSPATSVQAPAAVPQASSGEKPGGGEDSGSAADEGQPSPGSRATAGAGTPDSARGAERASATTETTAATVEARALAVPRSGESERGPQTQAASQTPVATPHEVEHAAAILRQVRMRLVPGTREATLQLEPAHLGRLSIRLELRRGTTRAEVVVEELAALDALARHEPELRAALADAGFAGVEVELRHAGDGAGRNPFSARHAAPAARVALAQPAHDAPLVQALAARLGAGEGVDTYA